MIENLLDPAHLQFAHEGQQGAQIGPRDKNFPEGLFIFPFPNDKLPN